MTPLLLDALLAPDGWAEAQAPAGVLADDRHALLMRHANGAEALLDRRGPTVALHLPAHPDRLAATWSDAAVLDPVPVPQPRAWQSAGTLDFPGPEADPALFGEIFHAQAGPPAWEGLAAAQALLAARFPGAHTWSAQNEAIWELHGQVPRAFLTGHAALRPLLDAAGWRALSPQGGLVRPDRLVLRPCTSAHDRARVQAAARSTAVRHGTRIPSWWPR